MHLYGFTVERVFSSTQRRQRGIAESFWNCRQMECQSSVLHATAVFWIITGDEKRSAVTA